MNAGLHRRPGRAAQHLDGTDKHNEQIQTGVTLLTTVDKDWLVKNVSSTVGWSTKDAWSGLHCVRTISALIGFQKARNAS